MTLLFYPALAGLYRCAKMPESLYLSVITVTATSHRHTVKTGQPKGSPSLVGKSPLVGLWRFLLTLPGVLAYGCLAAPQWVAGFRSLKQLSATQTPQASFFVSCQRIPAVSMVALVEQPLGWPVSDNAGTANSASVTTLHEFRSSGGDSFELLSEATAMVATPTPSHPEFTFRFLALSRADRSAKPCRLSVEANSEHEARSVLAPHFILSFAARLPAQGAQHD